MKKILSRFIPEIPILDCEEHSPYMQAKVIHAIRKDKNLYYVELSDLNKGLIKKSVVEGDVVAYKIQKKVEDGVCTTNLIVV
jgi:hypothetical protein